MEISLKDLMQVLSPSLGIDVPPPFPIGTAVYVRGCIYSAVGKLESCDRYWVKLSSASYIGTDGAFSEATANGIQSVEGSEIEPVGGDGILVMNRDAVSDICRIPEPLPSERK